MDRRRSLFDFAEGLVSWQKLLPYVLLLTITFAIYGPSLYFDFIWDDFYYIERNYPIQGLSLAHLRAMWTQPILSNYAPLQQTLLALLYHLFAKEPLGYHLAQLLLHAACVSLLFFVLKETELARVAFLASLLFAVHPANTETVAWVSETKSTLAFLFFLLSFWTFLRFRKSGRLWLGGVCAVFFVLSLLAKINTVVAPAIFLLSDYREGKLNRKTAWSLAAFFLLGALFVAIHLKSFYESPTLLASSVSPGLWVRLQNLPLLILFYVRVVIFPNLLSAWHVLPVYETFNWVVGSGWIALLGVVWLFSRMHRDLPFWVLWFLVFLTPVLQIFPIPIAAADRYLYIPVIGLFVLWSRLFFWVWDRLSRHWAQRGWELCNGAILLALAWHTWDYLPIWRNDVALWEATVKTCPNSADCHASWGLSLIRNGQPQRGGEELIRAVRIQPTPWFLMYLGDAFALNARDYERAILAYRRALERADSPKERVTPSVRGELYAKLGRAYYWAGDMNQASQAVQAGKNADASAPRLWVVDGFVQWKQGNWVEARRSLQTAFFIAGQTSDATGFLLSLWENAGEVGRLLSDLRSAPSPSSERGKGSPPRPE